MQKKVKTRGGEKKKEKKLTGREKKKQKVDQGI